MQAAPRTVGGTARTLWATIRRLRWTEFRLLIFPSILSIVGIGKTSG